MAGRKLFTNDGPHSMAVTLVIRASEDPHNQAGTKEFRLDARQSQWQDYGNDRDIYLNGIKLIASFQGQMLGQQYIVITRGSPLDNELNMRNGVNFRFEGGSFMLSTRQVN